MFDFIFILTAILEIILTCILTVQILKFEKKVIAYNEKITLYGTIIIELNKKITDVISKINMVVSVLRNKKFLMIKKTVQIIMSTIQIILLLRSLKFGKDEKLIDFEELKKLILTEAFKRLVKKLVFD